jgi:glutamyl-tRNA synthetase
VSVRVRIAPAPSGSLHVGNVRTALYNWLFARKQGGAFVLRIEDTDQSRASEEAYQAVLEDLRWIGLDWDEGPEAGGPHGPYRDSERLATYAEAANKLFDIGAAYRCYCTPEELDQRRKLAHAEGRKPGYDGRCFRLSDQEKSALVAEGRPWVLRFHVPEEGSTTFDDLITGTVTVAHSEIDDFAIMRQNGFPLYVLAAAVDDALMEITHVVRGLDIQSATPRQILILGALGHPIPRYGHIPLVTGPDRKPLSKRHGSTTIEEFRAQGFLPETMTNYLAFLGWGTAATTIISKEDLISRFAIEDVHPSPAMLDFQKLSWMNGEYIRMLTDAGLAARLQPFFAKANLVADPPTAPEQDLISKVAPLVKTRIETLSQALALVQGIFKDIEPDTVALEKVRKIEQSRDLLSKGKAALEALDDWSVASIESTLRKVVEDLGLKPRIAFLPFYVAITGSTVSAPLFDSIHLIGKEKTLQRLEATIIALA